MLGKVNRYPKRIKLRNTFKKIIKKNNLLLQFFYISHRSSAKTLLK